MNKQPYINITFIDYLLVVIDRKGHYLFVFDTNQRKKELNITSPEINPAYFDKNIDDVICSLSLALNTFPKQTGNVSVLIQEGNRTKVIANRLNIDDVGWQIRRINLGHPEEPFRIILEIGSTPPGLSYVAIDNIKLENCFPESSEEECPPGRKFRCVKDSICIALNKVCDAKRDCSDMDDEKQNCDKVPAGTRCTFENGWCGWRNTTDKHHTLKWKLNSGPTRNKHTGPSHDNTYANETGTYAYVDMSTGTLGSLALMESVPINPPPPVHSDIHSPHYNSCYVTFFYHKFGPHSGSLGLYIREEKLDSPRNSQRLWWSYGNKGDTWLRQVVVLPNITERYSSERLEWIRLLGVSEEKFRIIAKGARGGKGADALGESKSAMVRIVTELHKGDDVYLLVGQEGQDACKKLSFDTPSCVADIHLRTVSFKQYLKDPKIKDGGGGMSLLEGGVGGKSCYSSTDSMKGTGGFGGGGGGCVAGGGGGGFTGGRAWTESSVNGEGGWSIYTERSQYQDVKPGVHYGAGSVLIIPSVSGCGCSFKCAAMDEARTTVKCICRSGTNLGTDTRNCILRRCQEQQKELTERKVCGAGVQLNHLNSVPTSVRLTEFNPNYEFGGATYTLRDLKEISREKIQLVKSFGVLLWEVMSLGFMPYTGIPNREVMIEVARGARLGAPANCPPPVFSIMGMCWSHDPEQRPSFSVIVERLGYCIQDPVVINTQLPVYKGPLPSELDKTLMRPKSEEDYMQTDYMIPIMPDTPSDWKDEGMDALQK
ncbi:hypothetical protein PGB90_003234 [Kerria lacca]